MRSLLICVEAHAPTGWRLDDWSREAAGGAEPGLELVALSEFAELDRFAAMLEEKRPRAVVIGGIGHPDHLVYCRLRGYPVILLLDDAAIPDLARSGWTRNEVGLPFYADRCLAVGQGPDRNIETGEGAVLPITKVPAFSSREQLAAVITATQGLEDRAETLPAAPSTLRRILDMTRLRSAVATQDRRREVRIVRRLAEAWVQRDLGADFDVRPQRPMRDCPRILLISHDFSKTGAPMALYWALRALLDRHEEAEYHVLGIGSGPMEELFARLVGDRVTVSQLGAGSEPWTGVLNDIDAIDPDLVFVNGSPAYPLIPLLTWKGYPTLWWYHEGLNVEKRDGHLFTRRSLESLVRYGLGLPAAVMTASMDTVRELERFCPEARGRTRHVPYGFEVERLVREGDELRRNRADIRRELGIGADDLFIVCVGSLERRKNQKRLVLAFEAMLDRLPKEERARCHLISIGNLDPDRCAPDNYHRECLEAVRPEYADQIRFLGPQPSAFPFIAAADAQALVSTNECSPLVNLESVLLGTIVISSRVHGIPEVIEDGERGYLVEPEDLADITSTLERFFDDFRHRPEALDRMRLAALDYVAAHHDVRHMGELIQRDIDNLLHLAALAGGVAPLSREVNQYLGQQLNLRWAYVKHDVVNEGHIAHGHSHHLYEAEGSPA